MQVDFELTEDARVIVIMDQGTPQQRRVQASRLITRPTDAHWEQMQRVLMHVFRHGMEARSREIMSLLRVS